MRSRIEPMKKIARSLRVHRPLLLNWFRARHYVRTGATEGMNNRLKLITKTAYGYRSDRILEIALFHGLGCLPEPTFTHRF
jgi:transposase